MKNKGILQEISDLLLKNSELHDWFKDPTLRFLWHTFIIYVIVDMIISFIVFLTPLSDILSKTSNGIFLYRVFMSFFVLIGLIFLFFSTFHYFRFTVKQGNSINFDSVLFFYISSIIFFGLLYYFFFNSSPDLFKYDTLHISWIPVIGSRTFDVWSNKFYFLLYSAFESIGGNFVYLQSNSILVSIANYAQTLYSFSLVSLLIGGYINQRTNKSA